MRQPFSDPDERSSDPVRVLLADDDADFRRLVSAALREAGSAVEEHADGATVLDALAACADGTAPMPDVLILDVRMPGYSGLGVLNALRHLDDPPLTIVVTGSCDASLDALARTLGAADVVHKPLDIEHLLADVLDLAARPRSRRVQRTRRVE